MNIFELFNVQKNDVRVCSMSNMTEDFSPKALVGVERLLELLGKGGVAS